MSGVGPFGMTVLRAHTRYTQPTKGGEHMAKGKNMKKEKKKPKQKPKQKK